MNPGEQADAAVGLLLALQREVVLGDIDKELAQQLRQCRKRHAAADAKPDQRTQQPRQRRVQLRCGVRLVRGRFRVRDLAFMANYTGTRRGRQSHFFVD
jgi:hypothetical protein